MRFWSWVKPVAQIFAWDSKLEWTGKMIPAQAKQVSWEIQKGKIEAIIIFNAIFR